MCTRIRCEPRYLLLSNTHARSHLGMKRALGLLKIIKVTVFPDLPAHRPTTQTRINGMRVHFEGFAATPTPFERGLTCHAKVQRNN